jgi:hypothetical protein
MVVNGYCNYITTLVASFYLYFGWQTYLTIVVGGIYNIGVNSQLVLLGGAYTKTPIDLSSGKGAFGEKKLLIHVNLHSTISTRLYGWVLNWNATIGLVVAAVGVLGLALKGFLK